MGAFPRKNTVCCELSTERNSTWKLSLELHSMEKTSLREHSMGKLRHIVGIWKDTVNGKLMMEWRIMAQTINGGVLLIGN